MYEYEEIKEGLKTKQSNSDSDDSFDEARYKNMMTEQQ